MVEWTELDMTEISQLEREGMDFVEEPSEVLGRNISPNPVVLEMSWRRDELVRG